MSARMGRYWQRSELRYDPQQRFLVRF